MKVAGLQDLTDGSISFFTKKLYDAANVDSFAVGDSPLPFFQINDLLWRKIPKKLREIDKQRYDVILLPSHSLMVGVDPARYDAEIVPIVHDLEWITSFEGNFIERFNVRKAVTNLRRADRILAISETTRTDLMTRTNVSARRVEVVLQGVDKDRIYRDEAEPKTVDLPDKFILNVGGLQPRKNPEFLVDVIEQLPDGWELVHAGNIYDEENKVELDYYAAKKGLAHKVHFLGYLSVKDLRRVYTHADVYLHSANFGGYERTPVEAATVGIPPVVYQGLPCLPDIEDVAIAFDEFDAETVAEMVVDAPDYVEYTPRSWQQTGYQMKEVLKVESESPESYLRTIEDDKL